MFPGRNPGPISDERRRLSDMNCGRTRPPGLSNRFRQQLGTGRTYGFDRTDIEPDDVAVTGRQIEHFTWSDQHAERGGTLDHVARVKAGRKMNETLMLSLFRPRRDAWYAAL